MKKFFQVLLIIIMLSALTSCSREISKEPTIVKTTFAMDTVCTIKVYDKDADNETVYEAFSYVGELENLLSRYNDSSDIAKINKNAGKEYVKVDERTLELIKKCVNYSEMTNGAFDITLGTLIDLWDINSGKNYIPSKSEIEEALGYTGYKKILIDEENCSVKLVQKGVIIDLSAVAKGYISQKIKEFLIEKGINSAIIDFGGNVVLIGDNYLGQNYSAGIQTPFEERGEYNAIIKSDMSAIVSSGNYERYFIGPDNKIYHHIIDPKTGSPAENGLSQVTIVCDDATDADILSTGIYVMGKENGYEFIEKTDNIGAVFVYDNTEIIVTENLKKYVNIIK